MGKVLQPRRLVLSAVACVLAVIWLGNAAMTIWLRETASPATLHAMLSLGLVLYAGWHFARRPSFDRKTRSTGRRRSTKSWSRCRYYPRDLVAYQFASVTVTTMFKAGLFTLLLLPDLCCLPLGFVGVLLAMMTLEMIRMAIEIATWGIGGSAYLVYRATVVAGMVAGGFAVGAVIVREDATVVISTSARTPPTRLGYPRPSERICYRLRCPGVSAIH